MNIDEAKKILEDGGFVLEARRPVYTLLDKHNVYECGEDDDPYVVVYGPAPLRRLKEFVDRNLTKDFSDIPFNPRPGEEPEEGFIIVGG